MIAPTQAAADEIVGRTRIPAERIRIVPHGVVLGLAQAGMVAATRSTLGLGDDPYVLWVGTVEPRKNLPLLLEAFRLAVQAGIRERLVIVGPPGWSGAPRAIAAATSALGDRLCFTGPLRSDRLAALYRGASLFAFPSLHEGFGLPVLEAMAQEVPVLSSDIPVLREVGGDVAQYVPANDVHAWADALVSLLGDERARRDLGIRGRARASHFTWEGCVAVDPRRLPRAAGPDHVTGRGRRGRPPTSRGRPTPGDAAARRRASCRGRGRVARAGRRAG